MDRFAICQAYQQLEADYNVGGILIERPSNQRRRESIGVQLHRMGYSNPFGYIDITPADMREQSRYGNDSCDADEVREVYMRAVLRLNLPIDRNLMSAMRAFFVPEFLAKYPQTKGASYFQNGRVAA